MTTTFEYLEPTPSVIAEMYAELPTDLEWEVFNLNVPVFIFYDGE